MPQNQQLDGSPEKLRQRRASFLSYHARECSICRHPERDSIDQEFVEWGAVGSIAAAYGIQRRAIYRHAHATNLFERRNRDLRFALGRIIEQAQTVEVTADSIVRAVRLFACLNDEGGWIGPPARSPLVRSARRTRQPGAWDENARSTHPDEQNASHLVENTQSQPAQIDTVPAPSRSPEFRNNRFETEQGMRRSQTMSSCSSIGPPASSLQKLRYDGSGNLIQTDPNLGSRT